MSETVVSGGGAERRLRVERDGGRWRVVSEEGREVGIEVVAVRDDAAELRIGERTRLVPFSVRGEQVELQLDGELWAMRVGSGGPRRRGRQAEHSMSAPMPGQVLKIFVEVGDVVAKGDPLIVLEAMKMEHQIVAPWDGRIESVACAPGDLVQPGVDLIAVAPEGAE